MRSTAAVCAIAALWAGPLRAEQIRVAYSAISGAMAPLWLAQDEGLFKKQSMDVQLLYIGGGAVVTQALLGGDVQFARIGANAAIQASTRGADLKMIANTINTLVFSLMARPEIQSPAQLKGKKIGVTRLGGSTDFALELALKKWGLQRGRDVSVLQTGGMPQLLGAVTSGAVDAGVISPPTNLMGKKLGLKELVDFGDIGIVYPNSVLVASAAYVSRNRPAALRFLRGYSDGIQRMRSDRAAAIKVLARYTKVEEPEILSELYRIYGIKYLEKIPDVKLEGVEVVLRTEAKGAEGAKAGDFVDNSLVAELEKEGWFKK